LPEDLSTETVTSILNQTHPIAMLTIFSSKSDKLNLAEKVSEVLNQGFNHIRLEHFDYILRVDGDTILPTNFLVENLKGEPDICGQAGYALLFRVQPFLNLLGGKLNAESDDSHLIASFHSAKLKVAKWKVQPILTRNPGKCHNTNYYLHKGKIMYKLGYEPVHVLYSSLQDWKNLFCVFGYLFAMLKRDKFDTFKHIRSYQVRRLFKL
jgi:hypothetical protein